MLARMAPFLAGSIRVLSEPVWARVVGTFRSLPFLSAYVGWGKDKVSAVQL